MTRLQATNVSHAGGASGRHNELVLDGERFILDDEAAEFMRDVLEAVQHGDDVTLARPTDMLSTQEAADMLGISRPSLVKLLDQSIIPSHRPGTHRRVRRADVDAFLSQAQERRSAALREFRASRSPEDEAEGFVTTR